MKKLELLGLQPDGHNLTLNDEEGNRYLLPVTDDLRAALRKDPHPSTPAEEITPMGPREIQALVRAGHSVDEISEMAALPPSRISALAYPIIAERNYTAAQARNYTLGRDVGGFTVEELVTSRLVARDVDTTSITWDAVREAGQPWALIVRFVSAGREHEARWFIDTDRHTLQTRNDEASWLSETSLTADAGPWRPDHTPAVVPGTADTVFSGTTPAAVPAAVPASPSALPSAADTPPARASIDEVLASLDSQRGKSRPMPDADHDIDPDEWDGAHRAPEDEEELRAPATIVSLPSREGQLPGQRALLEPEELAQTPALRPTSAPDADSDTGGGLSAAAAEPNGGAEAAPASAPVPEKAAPASAPEKTAPATGEPRRGRKRTDRPTMPSWDEIVFGKKD
ncbi:septation protein SepH [Actinotignum sanguinis]|uniref:Septation protein SepH n=3 Tax=Actinomycetaceae TaxID=2049 RepID=A0ABZ0RDT9_9ACTO|nr:septation protein SepH [Actinotignum sanguinis]WPJ89528.1 septation protein SepH [Schaalia turicensis]MDE1553375.1 septation protein SepH [Actinotignum sanguinis]MDE1565714.1 septation protein SepH [Actinotignum sanguinis]MDE1577829.1 septation protein SepH [Actinotignum sanguinis]MDE1642433.1 septation protein SepH [Actinotignum sanguinis]